MKKTSFWMLSHDKRAFGGVERVALKVLLGLSGGFDSAYSARLLMQEGYEVEGAVLDMHRYTETEEAKIAARELGIPIHVISCRELFEKEVVCNFCDEYLVARTPNPCIVCNERVKFRVLYDYAMAHGFDRIATGHYARIDTTDGNAVLLGAADRAKDQSYMLYRLPQEILRVLLLPMGNIIKKEAKETEIAVGITAREREESQEICFVGEENYADFIERRVGVLPQGEFVSESGEVLGTHKGIIHYTVGQRKGLGVSAASRLFVREIDTETGKIVLSDVPPRVCRFVIESPVFSGMTEQEVLASATLNVRVRYTATPVPARVWRENGVLLCELETAPRVAVAYGQSAVFYDGDRVAFGGFIGKGQL